MTYASINDVADELGRPVPDGPVATQWGDWIRRVERGIARAFRAAGLNLEEQVSAGQVSLDDLADVIRVRVAARVLIGDDIVSTSSTVSVDDASVTTRRDGVEQTDPLSLTESDLAALLPVGGGRGAFSTRPGFEPDRICLPGWLP